MLSWTCSVLNKNMDVKQLILTFYFLYLNMLFAGGLDKEWTRGKSGKEVRIRERRAKEDPSGAQCHGGRCGRL